MCFYYTVNRDFRFKLTYIPKQSGSLHRLDIYKCNNLFNLFVLSKNINIHDKKVFFS